MPKETKRNIYITNSERNIACHSAGKNQVRASEEKEEGEGRKADCDREQSLINATIATAKKSRRDKKQRFPVSNYGQLFSRRRFVTVIASASKSQC